MAPGSSTRIQLLSGLLLALAALPVAARQPAMMDANGGGASACPLGTDDEAAEETPALRPDKRPSPPTPARATPTRRAGDAGTATRPPRWHSFLPGMIR